MSLTAFVLGMVTTARISGSVPAWVNTAILTIIMVGALAYGFTGAVGRFDLLRTRAIRGTAWLFLGLAAIFVPYQFALAAICIGYGTHMVWTAACDYDDHDDGTPPAVWFLAPGTHMAKAANGEIAYLDE